MEVEAIKQSHFGEEQIAFVLRQAEGGTQVGEICQPKGNPSLLFDFATHPSERFGLISALPDIAESLLAALEA